MFSLRDSQSNGLKDIFRIEFLHKKQTRLARLQSDSEDDYERDVDDGMSGDDDGRVDRAGDDDEGGDDRCRR